MVGTTGKIAGGGAVVLLLFLLGLQYVQDVGREVRGGTPPFKDRTGITTLLTEENIVLCTLRGINNWVDGRGWTCEQTKPRQPEKGR